MVSRPMTLFYANIFSICYYIANIINIFPLYEYFLSYSNFLNLSIESMFLNREQM